jgi:hypothetical protein
MRQNNFNDTEYLSYYITEIRHYDAWNEEVEHTREVEVGRDKDGRLIYRTETYTTIEYHPECCEAYYNDDFFPRGLSKKDFERLRDLWKTPMRFIDMHRNYYTIDGDAQEYAWDGEWDHMETLTIPHTYSNMIQGSGSVLKFREIKPEEAKELGLYDYDIKSVYGIRDSEIEKKFSYLNAMYGKSKEVHFLVLIYDAEKYSSEVSEDQRAYWQGGNKNEFVICLGVENNQIKWANCFSWQEDKTMETVCRSWLMENKTMNLLALGDWLEANLGMWKRREFTKDFSYIQTYLTGLQVLTIWIIVLVLTIIGFIVFYHEYKNRWKVRDLWYYNKHKNRYE